MNNNKLQTGGVLIDFVSGQTLKQTPEEEFATQPFSKILVQDYGYRKSDIVTRPQYRVKTSPSDKKGYPIDIAVFEDNVLKIIVECKKPTVKLVDTRQLESYLAMSEAEIGVMFNGEDSIYLHKVITKQGISFERIPSIPKRGEKLHEIGLYRKDQLEPTHNLKSIFSEIRGWIVANGNITRDSEIASQIMLLILCKIYDERFTEDVSPLMFRASLKDSDDDIRFRIDTLFNATKSKYDDVIESTDKIEFDGKTLRGIIGRLQRFSLINTDRDCIADAFEVFVGKSIKEKEGQFFTPRNVIQMMIAAIDLKIDSYIIDNACGSGGFLVNALKRIEEIIREKANRCGWSESAIQEEIKAQAVKYIRGTEKDPFLTKLTKSYMAILGDGKGGIFREDALNIPAKWDSITQQHIKLETFDFLLANPPFGKNIKVTDKDILKQFSLAGKLNKKGVIETSETGNVSSLFLERDFQLLKSGDNKNGGGKLAIILPEPYFALKKYSAAIDLMIEGNNIQWIIDLPQNTFRPHNNAKCCAIIIQKDAQQQEFINMAVAEYIGHDHQGKPIFNKDGSIRDDAPQIIEEIKERNTNNGELVSNRAKNLTFKVKASEVIRKKILIPRFYWDENFTYIKTTAEENGFNLLPLNKMIDEEVVTFFNGHGSPKGETKGLGDIPYIRVKDIVNWQAYCDVTAMIPRSEYDAIYKEDKRLLPRDILYVSRGSYRIGSVAMVSPYDGEMLLTREIIVIRVKENNKYGLTPEYLLYALSHRYIWEQTKNKIFYEPCLPNIGERWKDLYIPVPKNENKFREIKQTLAEAIYNKQWQFKSDIYTLKQEYGAYMI